MGNSNTPLSVVNSETECTFVVYGETKGECGICRNENISLLKLSKNCKHKSQYCLECLRKTIESGIKKGECKFACNAPKCQVIFDSIEYLFLLSNKYRNIVSKLLFYNTLEQNKEFRWCKNSGGCGGGQLVTNWRDLKGYYTCYYCQIPLCFKHEIEWHQGMTCNEFDEELKNNPSLRTDITVLNLTKQCPNCNTSISKLEGCDVITCCRYGTHGCQYNKKRFKECDHGSKVYCGQKFCWICLGKITQNKNNTYSRTCKKECKYNSLND